MPFSGYNYQLSLWKANMKTDFLGIILLLLKHPAVHKVSS